MSDCTSNNPAPAGAGLPKLYTVKQVAGALGRHGISIYKAAAGLISMPIPRFVRIGRDFRFREEDARAFIDGLDDHRHHSDHSPEVTKKGRPCKAAQIAKRAAKGGGCSVTRVVVLKRVIDMLPWASSSIYSGFNRVRFPWLTRRDPLTGRRGRELFVLLDVLEAWAAIRGMHLHADLTLAAPDPQERPRSLGGTAR
ncbi:hypothetical protein [Rhodoferax sp.]|uniref:hypothetical protein n=1 Tax=Rhodoferax sp. TaxID=50421 RepID=UPI0027486985|nr:hypothetical protein [Rhodoferax sp.]